MYYEVNMLCAVCSLWSLDTPLSKHTTDYFLLYCKMFGSLHPGTCVCVCVSWLTENAFLVGVSLQVESVRRHEGIEKHPVWPLKVLVAPWIPLRPQEFVCC